jgi:hypothetical protein
LTLSAAKPNAVNLVKKAVPFSTGFTDRGLGGPPLRPLLQVQLLR